MDIHNALYIEYQEQNLKNWKKLKKDMKTLEETNSKTGT
jgi:hypothetical protein